MNSDFSNMINIKTFTIICYYKQDHYYFVVVVMSLRKEMYKEPFDKA